ncbi:MAG: hypothetical protein VB934_11250 [Polyangiaceae bacterium]
MSGDPSTSLVWRLMALGALSLAVACGGPPPAKTVTDGPAKQPAKALPAVAVSDSDFAYSVHRLLTQSEPSDARLALLAGTVERQLQHASQHFKQGRASRGTDAVVGALYLLRAGELSGAMATSAVANQALSGANAVFSSRGDEGRARAVMELRLSGMSHTDPRRVDIQAHLDALKRWTKETHTGGDMVRLAAEQRAAMGRALLAPDKTTLQDAMNATSRWIERAVTYNLAYQQTRQLPPRQEAGEAFRALRTGAETMAALFLRNGDARGAVDGVKRSSAGRIVDPDLFALLRAAAQDDTAQDWRLLVRHFVTTTRDNDPHALGLDVLDAALWGVALEAFRRDRSSLVVGHVLARQLVRIGIPEAAPLVLADALGAKPSPASLSSATSFIGSTLADAFDGGSSDAARRVFAASQAILRRADEREYRGRVDPSAAKLRFLMADIEIRDGHSESASSLLAGALEREPSVWGYTKLATLERQRGDRLNALRHARNAVALPAARVLPFDAIRAQHLQFELLREAKKDDEAATALGAALDTLLSLRTRKLKPAGRIQRERLLARTLDRYGERDATLRAFERAMNLAKLHREMLPATALDFLSWSLSRNERTAARDAVHALLQTSSAKDPLVYGALWLMLLEEKAGKKPSSVVERVLLDAKDDEAWRGKLARWGRGELSNEMLLKSASQHTERTEARFYAALRRYQNGDASAAADLHSVGSDPLIDLLEVRIARELFDPRDHVKLPKGKKLP